MRKHILPVLLVIAVLLVAAISCKNNPSPTPTLSVYSFRNFYFLNATKTDLVGTLAYTDTAGKVTTVDIKDASVTTDFDASKVAEGKILKISYQGIDTTAVYNVVKVDEVDISGSFILDKNVTYVFTSGSRNVKKETWTDWGQFYNLSGTPAETSTSYTVTLSPSGRTVIKMDDWTYTPDKTGGLASYPSEGQFFDYDAGYVPNTGYYYVSTTKEDSRTIEQAKNKYLVMQFKVDGNVDVWFTADPTLSTPLGEKAYTISAEDMIFDNSGVYLKNVTADAGKGKNLSIYLNKDGYASKERAFSIVSSSDDGYKGYSYTMKLTDIEI